MRIACLFLLGLAACGGKVVFVDGDGGEGGAPGSGAAPADGGSSASGTDLPMVPPGQVFAHLACEGDFSTLVLEIWPYADEECVPPSGVDLDEPGSVLLIVVYAWDFSATTFEMFAQSPHGNASAVWSSDGQGVDGTFTIEPYSGSPAVVSWTLDTLYPLGSGRTDISLCADFEGLECNPF